MVETTESGLSLSRLLSRPLFRPIGRPHDLTSRFVLRTAKGSDWNVFHEKCRFIFSNIKYTLRNFTPNAYVTGARSRKSSKQIACEGLKDFADCWYKRNQSYVLVKISSIPAIRIIKLDSSSANTVQLSEFSLEIFYIFCIRYLISSKNC